MFLPKYPLAQPSERWASGRRRHVLKPASGLPTSVCESNLEDLDVVVVDVLGLRPSQDTYSSAPRSGEKIAIWSS